MAEEPELESQRERVPREDGGELAVALAFLRFVRSSVQKKLEGLDDEQLRRRVLRSDTTLLGLVQHLTVGERYWFDHVVAGHEPERGEDDWEFSMVVPAERTSAEVLEAYSDAIAAGDAAILAAGDLDALTALPVDEAPKTVRWVVAHMTGEVARHAGHADVVRELVDGTTGR